MNQVATSPILSRFPRSVVPNGIDLKIFQPADRKAVRAELGLPAQTTLVMVGANHLNSPYKPARHAVDAINMAARQHDISAILVGHSVDQVQSELSVRSWAMPYTADRALLAKYYQAADIFLLPAIEETYGLMAAEAMACGCCVVAYASGALPELIDSDETGKLVERGNPTALSEAIQALCACPERISQLGSAATKHARERFGFEKHVSRLLDLLHDLIASRTSAAATRRRPSPVSTNI